MKSLGHVAAPALSAYRVAVHPHPTRSPTAALSWLSAPKASLRLVAEARRRGGQDKPAPRAPRRLQVPAAIQELWPWWPHR